MNTLTAILERKLRSTEEYLIVQRPKTGLLASFWEFPSLDLEEDLPSEHERSRLLDDRLASLGLTVKSDQIARRFAVGQVNHVFSHIKQTIHLEAVELKGDMQVRSIHRSSPISSHPSLRSQIASMTTSNGSMPKLFVPLPFQRGLKPAFKPS